MLRYERKSGTLHATMLIVLVFVLGFFGQAYADAKEFAQGKDNTTALDLSLSPALIEQTPAVSHPDLTGFWVLDRTAGDDPKEVVKAARAGGARSFPGDRDHGGSGRGTGDGGGGRFGHKPGDGRMGRDASFESGPIVGLFLDQFEVIHQEPLLTITSTEHGTRKIYTDYRASSVSAMGDLDQPVTTGGWEGTVLVIEMTTAGGNHAIQRLQLLTEPRRLERVTEFKMRDKKGKPIQIRQIFLLKDQQTGETASHNSDAD